MNRTIRIALIPIVLIGLIMTFSCSDTEHRIPIGSARVVINMGLPPETPDAELGLIERIRRLFVPDAIAQSAPAAFSSILVRVTGADFGAVEESFGPYSTISMNVPAGALRIFEVTAIVAPGDPSAAASFKGTASATCPAGQTVNVPVVMGLNETKIVVPDYQSNQIVQIDSFANGNASWKTNQLGYGFSAYFYDIDFDARGRIYIARFTASGNESVIRINNIDSITYDLIVNSSDGTHAIAIDRKNNYLYYATSEPTSLLYRISCNGGTATGPYATLSIQTIRGMAFEENENVLYMAGINTLGQSAIFKYSLNSSSVIATYINASLLIDPWHVLIKSPNIYVANLNGPAGYRILLLNSNLQLIQGYGNVATIINTNRGMFYGPRRFLAILNRKITIIDDEDFANVDKLVSMDNINGDGWDTYGSYNMSAGTGYFKFYHGT